MWKRNEIRTYNFKEKHVSMKYLKDIRYHTIVRSVALLIYVECWRTQCACVIEWPPPSVIYDCTFFASPVGIEPLPPV